MNDTGLRGICDRGPDATVRSHAGCSSPDVVAWAGLVEHAAYPLYDGARGGTVDYPVLMLVRQSLELGLAWYDRRMLENPTQKDPSAAD